MDGSGVRGGAADLMGGGGRIGGEGGVAAEEAVPH
jgi:hypothetical protein